jgi:hypothetical protein
MGGTVVLVNGSHIENWAADTAESGPDATQIGKWTAGRPVRPPGNPARRAAGWL